MWISVKDKLPKRNTNVLCQGKYGGIYIGQWQGDRKDDDFIFRYWHGEQYMRRECVAWQELPKPYDEEER